MSKAYIMVRTKPEYRSEAFVSGAAAMGYQPILTSEPPKEMKPDELLVTWNAHGRMKTAIEVARKAGATHILTENGYAGKDSKGIQHYALAFNGHCGSGQWRVGGPERWERLGMHILPRRMSGNHILVCDQRGLGSDYMKSPAGFGEQMFRDLKKAQDRDVIVRRHPGRHQPQFTLEQQMDDAWAVVVWSSNVATTALLAGYPVFYCAPHIITEGACEAGVKNISNPVREGYDLRLQTFQRLAWAQWTVAEIASGAAFDWLLNGDGDMTGGPAGLGTVENA